MINEKDGFPSFRHTKQAKVAGYPYNGRVSVISKDEYPYNGRVSITATKDGKPSDANLDGKMVFTRSPY